MTRPSSNAPRSALFFVRNRWISPRQAEMLESLWNARLRRAGRRLRPERSQEERLRHIAETVGRKVENVRELTWRDANRVLRRLLDEVRAGRASRVPDVGQPTVSARDLPSAPRARVTTSLRKTRQVPPPEKNAPRSKEKSAQRRKPQP